MHTCIVNLGKPILRLFCGHRSRTLLLGEVLYVRQNGTSTLVSHIVEVYTLSSLIPLLPPPQHSKRVSPNPSAPQRQRQQQQQQPHYPKQTHKTITITHPIILRKQYHRRLMRIFVVCSAFSHHVYMRNIY